MRRRGLAFVGAIGPGNADHLWRLAIDLAKDIDSKDLGSTQMWTTGSGKGDQVIVIVTLTLRAPGFKARTAGGGLKSGEF